ncbi:hypothetical protein HJG60_010558 [Phyllostomus discolor]|uniref:Uncharacterized protein n=1 Tax=Phyllostomus discolor TaxID=89673 RepID=A0A834AND1_9CHIR|nr:hypothetical protein HJG60_010558 [Phyllostomus discolor]
MHVRHPKLLGAPGTPGALRVLAVITVIVLSGPDLSLTAWWAKSSGSLLPLPILPSSLLSAFNSDPINAWFRCTEITAAVVISAAPCTMEPTAPPSKASAETSVSGSPHCECWDCRGGSVSLIQDRPSDQTPGSLPVPLRVSLRCTQAPWCPLLL